MKAYLKILLLVVMTYSLSAAEQPEDPKKQTPWKLYLNSKEAYDLVQKEKETTLFIDVRDPIEIMFTGFTNEIDVNIPYKIADKSTWNDKKNVFMMIENQNFENDVNEALVKKGLSKDASIIIMCRSGGTRGAPCANKLWGKGFSKVYVVTDGFQGTTSKDTINKGKRIVNGWKNSKLPWSYKMNKSKMYNK